MTTQAKHTPGPWQVTHLRAGIDRINQFRIGTGPFGEIARTPELPYEIAQENEANARLIASAPALFDYVTKQAQNGDTEAAELLKGIYGRA